MPSFGINPTNGVGNVIAKMFGGRGTPVLGTIVNPFCLVFALTASAAVNSWQNTYDSDFVVGAEVHVETVDATETMDIGVAATAVTNDTLFDALDVATAGVFSSSDDGDSGTNGLANVLLNKAGGTTTFLVWTASAGTDTLAGFVIFTLKATNS